MPGQLIEAWIGEELDESAAVLALLALVAIVHQPIYLLTQPETASQVDRLMHDRDHSEQCQDRGALVELLPIHASIS